MIECRSLLTACLISVTFCTSIWANERLSVQIDRLIDVAQVGPVAGLATDAEFLRRVFLDLHGTIPTSAEARAFVDDPSPDKRRILVDRLISTPRFAVHMATVFDVMLMERRAANHVKTPEWVKYLEAAFEKDTPYNQLVKEILSADGADPNTRAAARFYLDRDAEPHLLTRDVGRIFFGMDLQCAQCHDHPLVDHYLQTDYYGLYAFLNRTTLFTDANEKKSFLGEKSDGDATYKSVFTQDAGLIRPQLPGDNEIEEPRYRQDEDYVVAPLANVRPIPKYSRRAKLAELATNGSNRQFNLNITNRLWAMMMGKGLVHPVDLLHPGNPPTNPEVLDLLATEFVKMNYSVRSMLRELALTRVYQRSIDPPPADLTNVIETAYSMLPVVTNDIALLESAAQESRKLVDAAQTDFKAARTTLATAEAAWRTAETAVTAAKKPLDESRVKVAKAQTEAETKKTAIAAVNEAVAKSAEVAKLLPKDKEVAAAAATFTTKQKQLTDELAAVEKSVADLLAAEAPLKAKLAEAHPPADAAYTAYAEARKPVDAAKTKLIATWNQHKAHALAVSVRQKHLEGIQSLLALRKSRSAIVAARTQLESQQAEIPNLAASVEQQQLQVATLRKSSSDIEQVIVAAKKALNDIQSRLEAKQVAIKTVAEAIEKIEAAQRVLSGDAELSQTIQKLSDRVDSLKRAAEILKSEQANSTLSNNDAESRLAQANQALSVATAELTRRQAALSAKNDQINRTLASLKDAELAAGAGREQLVDRWTAESGIRGIKQLSPEQIGWATIQATGILESQRTAADAEVEKTIPKATAAADATNAHLRETKVEQQLNEVMRGVVAPFLNLYASTAGQSQDDFFATPDQALFVANGGNVIGWAAGGQLAAKLINDTNPNSFAEELYLSTLTRRPTDAEVAEVTKFMESRSSDRPQAIRDLIWSMLTSVEFRFNH